MNILVSGAQGLVGFDLIRILVKKNHKVFALYRTKNKKKNLHHRNLIWKKMDLKNPINLKTKIDIIIHCAVIHEFSKNKKINDYIDSNILSLTNLADYAKRSGTKLIINFSTIAVFGEINVKKLSENYMPIKQNLLGVTKQLSENYLFTQPVNFINLRFPGILCTKKNISRPWLQIMINKIKNNNLIKVHNMNNYFNNVIDTTEIGRFILRTIKNKKKIRDTFILSASKPLKLKGIIKIIKNKYRSRSKILSSEKNERSFVLSTKKISKKLNFYPLSTEKIIMRNL
tara:strand:- start:1282 stop:2139 length:858 start_codon:yes stop_codon:yes gene_type:complete